MKTLNRVIAVFALSLAMLAGSSTDVFGRPREPWPPLPEFARVLFHESFDALYSYRMTNAQWTIPDYGVLIESWSGYALQRSGKVPPFSVPAVDRSGRTNLALSGALRFWVKPYWTSAPDGPGPGNDVCLAELLLRGESDALPLWWIEASRDGSVVSLIQQTDRGPVPVLKAAICWTAGEWHQVTLNFGPSTTALYLDGSLAAEGAGLVVAPLAATELVIGSAHTGERSLEGELEEVCTFARPLTAGFHYESQRRRAALGPITPEEDLAVAEWRARLRAEREAAARDQGPPMLRLLGSTPECITNLPVYVTNVVSAFDTNAGWTVTFDIQGSWDDSTNALYDVFMTPYLAGNSISNSQWVWLERGPSCSTYQYTNQPDGMAFYVVGTPLDSDGDGLTDALEQLVTHTGPYTSDSLAITSQPLGQTVYSGDTVTFSAVAAGIPILGYQWRLDGVPIAGATNRSLTLPNVQLSQAGDYSVVVSAPTGLYVTSSNATLTVWDSGWMNYTPVIGPRQDYTFKSGTTYAIASPVQLLGLTRIQGGTVIKFASWTDSSLQIAGSVQTDTKPYYPAILTSLDDDSAGQILDWSNGWPATASNGVAYVDLTFAQAANPDLRNLRFCYADQAVRTPASAAIVELWDCQFVQCVAAVADAPTNQTGTVRLHNVLVAGCQAAIQVHGTNLAVAAEQVTADVGNFCTVDYAGGAVAPALALTNSIVVGSLGGFTSLVTNHSAINHATPVFQTAGAGHYYLTNGSPYRKAGTTNISSRLRAEFQRKSTQPPLVFREHMVVAGEMALLPQAEREAVGPPDLGYHYDVLDYVVENLVLKGGTITMHPGTATAVGGGYYYWSTTGFDLRENSTFISAGTPTAPNIFASLQFVQEGLTYNALVLFAPDVDLYAIDGPVPTCAAPSLRMRCSELYLAAEDFAVFGAMANTVRMQIYCTLGMVPSIGACRTAGCMAGGSTWAIPPGLCRRTSSGPPAPCRGSTTCSRG